MDNQEKLREYLKRVTHELQKTRAQLDKTTRKNNEPIDSPVFDRIGSSPVGPQRALMQMAQAQLGTVGSGNHYVDVLEDETGRLWVACHFGSRGIGHKTATGFMNIAQGRTFHDGKGEGHMDSSSPRGR